MKKFYLFLLITAGLQAAAQTYPVTSINISLPANPDANTANWGTGASQLTVTANTKAVNGRVEGLVQEIKVLITIKKGAVKVCGAYASSSAPSANFNTVVKVWSGSNATALLGQGCILPAGDYELSVQFFGYSNGKTVPFSEEKTKAFTIRGNEQQAYQAPQVIAPINGTVFTDTDISKPLTFRWTPLIPRPQEPVTYRLRVWQLMQGQNGTQARTVNQPILTKDVDNLTQAMVSNLITGPCKPPYLCSFIWNVQALNREGKPVGLNNGTSEAFAFSVSSGSTATTRLSLIAPANGSTITWNNKMVFTWLPPTPVSADGYKIKIVEIIGDQSPEQAFRGNKPIFERDSTLEMHTNKPIFEKDSMPPPFIYLFPGSRFKAGVKYGWTVQAINREGKSVGGNGTSEVFTFSVKALK